MMNTSKELDSKLKEIEKKLKEEFFPTQGCCSKDLFVNIYKCKSGKLVEFIYRGYHGDVYYDNKLLIQLEIDPLNKVVDYKILMEILENEDSKILELIKNI